MTRAGERLATVWSTLASSLGLQLFLALFVVSCSLSALASIYDYRVEEAAARNSLFRFGRSLAHQAALACPDAVTTTDQPALQAYVDDLVVSERNISFAAVLRSDGKVLACSPRQDAVTGDATTLRIDEPIRIDRVGESIGTFVLGLSLRPMQLALRERATVLFLRSGLGFLLIAALFWLALRSMVMQPLHRLDVAAQDLGRGALEQPLPDLGRSELGRLSRTMDEMRCNLRSGQRSLEEQNRKLVEMNRLKSQFLTNVSHEMRTPMMSILGGVEQVLDPGTTAPERLEASTCVQRSGQKLLELVDRLLDMAKIESGNFLVDRRPCALEQVLGETLERFRPMAMAKGLAWSVDLAPIAGLTAVTDATRLAQLLGAIVDNAVKFTATGSVTVQARLAGGGADPSAVGSEGSGHPLASTSAPAASQVGAEAPTVQPSVAAAGRAEQLLQVVVTDTGIGIVPEYLPRLFQTFSQADGTLTRQHGGVGLGLAVARRIAQRLGGDIAVASESGKGTRVELSVAVERVATPATVAPTAAAATAATAPAAAAPLHGRVLVVDDAADNQRLLKALLTKAGLVVELAGNGREAVDAVERAAGGDPFALVLMDLQMPVLDGVSAIKELREHGHSLPIIALTAHALAEDRDRCIEAGADGYETKPITRKKLIDVVSSHLRT